MDRKCLHGVHPFYGTGPELLHILKLMSKWIQSLLLSNKMNDFICQTSNKTYPHVSTVKLDVSISCGTPDLDAHAEKMGNPVVVFHDVATDCGQQMALYVVNYLLLLLLKHNHSASNYITSVWRLKHNQSVHGHLIFITQRIIMSYRKWKKKIIIKFLGLQFSRRDPIFQKLMGPRTPFWKCLAPTLRMDLN